MVHWKYLTVCIVILMAVPVTYAFNLWEFLGLKSSEVERQYDFDVSLDASRFGIALPTEFEFTTSISAKSEEEAITKLLKIYSRDFNVVLTNEDYTSTGVIDVGG